MFEVWNLSQIIEIYLKRMAFSYEPPIHTIIKLFWIPVEGEPVDAQIIITHRHRHSQAPSHQRLSTTSSLLTLKLELQAKTFWGPNSVSTCSCTSVLRRVDVKDPRLPAMSQRNCKPHSLWGSHTLFLTKRNQLPFFNLLLWHPGQLYPGPIAK